MNDVDKVNQILNHSVYKAHLNKIKRYEADRAFCGHDLEHFLDVARIGYIWSFELGLKIDKSLIYGFALLHDIGRSLEYETGEAHDIASVRLAKEILEATDYRDYEKKAIIWAIEHHRLKHSLTDTGIDQAVLDANPDIEAFAELMRRADKASRQCYNCKAISDCYWDDDKKNMTIEV